ncbi:MAG: hypothetical protein K6U03_06010 [Firmicutes bacterium]|nr:hypothetical protein [Bacillota bacterium]
MGVVFSSLHGVFAGITIGVISGVLYGILLSIFMKKMKKKFEQNKPQIVTDKVILMEGPTNHFKGLEGVGGWLFLTSKELIFKSHSMNIQNHELVIPLDKIKDVKAVRTLGIIANGLEITTTEHKSERFVVNNQSIWVQKISEVKNKVL